MSDIEREFVFMPPTDHVRCPACGSERFQLGPRGGTARNVRCENGHAWNVTPFGWQEIAARLPLKEAP